MQVIRYSQGKRFIVRRIGSSPTDEELTVLYREAEIVREQLSLQPSLFSVLEKPSKLLHEDHLELSWVTHHFAYNALKSALSYVG